MTRFLLFTLLCATLLTFSCQPEPNETIVDRPEDSTAVERDSTLVHYLVDRSEIVGSDTFGIMTFRYDALKRMIAMTDSITPGLAPSYTTYHTYFYHGSEPWPWLSVHHFIDNTTNEHALDSIFYTYSGNWVASDSVISHDDWNSADGYTETRTFNRGAGTLNWNTRGHRFGPDPNYTNVDKSATFTMSGRNIGSFLASVWMDNAFYEAVYSETPDPLYRCSIPYPFPDVTYDYSMYAQPNLITSQTSGLDPGPSGHRTHMVKTYTSRADGYPVTETVTTDDGEEPYTLHYIYY